MDRRQGLHCAAEKYGLLAIYLFGSRADDGLRRLAGDEVESGGSDLDVGVAFAAPAAPLALTSMLIALDEVFSPLRVDLVPLERVDPLFRFRAIDGHRVFAADQRRADLFELEVMGQASELLPAQRAIERDLFGITTS